MLRVNYKIEYGEIKYRNTINVIFHKENGFYAAPADDLSNGTYV